MAENVVSFLIEAGVSGLDKLRNLRDSLGSVEENAALVRGAITGAFAGIGTMIMDSAGDIQEANKKIKESFQGTAKEMQTILESSKDLWTQGFGDSVSGVSDAATQAAQVLNRFGSVTETQLTKVTKMGLQFNKTFGTDTQETFNMAETLVKDFGISFDEAFDFIAAGFKKGLNAEGDFYDTLTEFSTQFADSGASASDFFSVLQTGFQPGSLGVEKAADVVKEFRLKISAMETKTVEALAEMGINGIQMGEQIKNGSLTTIDAFQKVIDGLTALDSKTDATRLGVDIIGTQYEDLGVTASGEINVVKTSMEDLKGSTDDLGIEYKTMGERMKAVWRSVKSMTFGAAEALNTVLNTVNELDTTTLVFLGTITTGMGIITTWNLGLRAVVTTLVTQATSLRATIASFRAYTATMTATTGVAYALQAAMVALVAIWAAFKVYEAAKALKGWYDAAKEAEEGAKRFQEEMTATMEKFKEFKNIPEIPADLTKKSKQELEGFKNDLQKTKQYYTALVLSLRQKASEETLFGNMTDEAKEAEKELVKAEAQLKKVNQEMGRVTTAGPKDAAFAASDAIKQFAADAKKAYDEAKKAAQDYANEVIKWEEKIKYAKLSTQDKIAELSLKGLSEEEQWAERKLQAEQKLSASKEALAKKDFALAEKLAKDAERLYANLATEVKSEDGNVTKTMEEAKKVAMSGVQEAGSMLEQIYGTQKEKAEKAKQEEEQRATKLKEQLDKLTSEEDKKIYIKVPELEEMRKKFEELTKEETKTIKVKTEEEKSDGGLVGLSRGGKLGGYSRIDSVHALLSPGERVINSRSTKIWDRVLPGFMHKANKAKTPTDVFRTLTSFVERIKQIDMTKHITTPNLIPQNKLVYAGNPGNIQSFSQGGVVKKSGRMEVSINFGDNETFTGDFDERVAQALDRKLREMKKRRGNV